ISAQDHSIDQNPQGINFAVGRPMIHTIFGQSPIGVAPLDLSNSSRIQGLLRNGKLYLSLDDSIALALENNLDIAIQRFNLPLSDTDILRAKAGSAPRGVSTGVVSGTPGGGGATTGAAGASGAGPESLPSIRLSIAISASPTTSSRRAISSSAASPRSKATTRLRISALRK